VNLIDKSERTDGTFSRSDFTFDTERDLYVCPGGKELRKYRGAFSTPREGVAKDGAIRYRAAQHHCDACMLKPKCCPNMLARKIARSVHEAARDKASAIAKTEAYAVSCRERKKVEMLFAHLKRILRLGRLRLRGPNGAKDEFLLGKSRKRCADDEVSSDDTADRRPFVFDEPSFDKARVPIDKLDCASLVDLGIGAGLVCRRANATRIFLHDPAILIVSFGPHVD
jgi:hypothetical protein